MELRDFGVETFRHKLEIAQRFLRSAQFTLGFHAFLYGVHGLETIEEQRPGGWPIQARFWLEWDFRVSQA
jgi:hypothetical protein